MKLKQTILLSLQLISKFIPILQISLIMCTITNHIDKLLTSHKCHYSLRNQGSYSLSGKTSCRPISWSFETERLDVIMIASQRCCCRGACQILYRLEKSKSESRGFETSRVLVVTLVNMFVRKFCSEAIILATNLAFFATLHEKRRWNDLQISIYIDCNFVPSLTLFQTYSETSFQTLFPGIV